MVNCPVVTTLATPDPLMLPISPEEMTAGIKAEIKTYDTDANSTLSLEEFAVMHAAHTRPMTVRAFQMHDTDGDAVGQAVVGR